MNFCPLCFKMLIIQDSEAGNRLMCNQCRYYFPLITQQKRITKLGDVEKQLLEVIQQNQSTKQLPTTKIRCQNCNHDYAYFEQRQTRSADQASTLFYTCVKCSHKWNEN